MHATTLSDGWTLTASAGLDDRAPAGVRSPVPAAVPGCAHTDLLAAGLIPDPYLDDHEDALRWMHGVDWQYRRDLRLEPAGEDERVDLVLEGVDTVATVSWGDVRLARTANMHRSYRLDVRALADGESRPLTVDLRSATRYAQEQRERLGARPSAYGDTPFNYVRKMACSFGWDWGPDLRTAGLWRPVRVERWRTARLERVRPLVDVRPDGTGTVELHLDVERSGLSPAGRLRVRASAAGVVGRGEVPAGATGTVLSLEVPHAPLWWPAGHGDQPLVEVVVELLDDAGVPLDRWTRRVGFRTVRLDTSPDEHGTRFVIEVNGRPIAVRGANWIPDDHLVTRVTRDRVERRLDQALGAHLNLIRVWGGGLYESEDFYTACDERGLLVWQDFLLACAAYPEEDPLRSEIEAEARENVVRLMPHPSLVLWNGGNENLWGHEDWGWQEQLGDATWGAWYATELFRDVVAELDPTRPYCDNSPYSPAASGAHPNDPDHGTHHQWEVWNRVDYTAYRDEIPRFCSEFGYQAPPAWRTLTDWVHADGGGPLALAARPQEDRVFLVHQKAEDGNGKLDRGMAPHLGVPVDLADWHWATQLQQAHAVRHAVEHHRSWWPRTAGTIVWQLNDCWPVTSWSVIDSQERPKPVWFALRRANAPRTLAVVERAGGLAVAVVNDADEEWRGALAVRRLTVDGLTRATARPEVAVPPRSVATVALDPAVAEPGDAASEVLVAELDGARAVHGFVPLVRSGVRPDAVHAQAEQTSEGYRVRVTAVSLALDVTLHADRVAPDAVVDDGLLTLLPGESASLVVRTAAVVDPAVLTAAPVLRTANDLLR